MTWGERMKSDTATLKRRTWTDFEKLPQVKNKRIYYNAICYDPERLDEYYEKFNEFAVMVASKGL